KSRNTRRLPGHTQPCELPASADINSPQPSSLRDRRQSYPRGKPACELMEKMERETRIELATNSLEGCDSTIELLPPSGENLIISIASQAPAIAFDRISTGSSTCCSVIMYVGKNRST